MNYNKEMIKIHKVRIFLPTSKVKQALLVSFLLLLFAQIFLGFKYFEDYLIIFIFALFLNDQFIKMKTPKNEELLLNEKKKRFAMSIVFLILLVVPTLFEFLHLSGAIQLFLYKLAFMIWAQIFLVDAFSHYKETKSKKWLLFTNTAVILIVIGAFTI